MHGVVVVAQAEQQAVAGVEFDFVLQKNAGQPGLGGRVADTVGCGRSGRIVIVQGVAQGRAEQSIVVFSERQVGGELPECDLLFAEIHGFSVHGILVVQVPGSIEHDAAAGGGQLVFSQKFDAVGVNTFPVNAVGAAPFGRPVEFAAEAVFVHVTHGEGSDAVVSAFEIPFIEHRNAVLQGHVGEVVAVDIEAVVEFEVIDSQQSMRCTQAGCYSSVEVQFADIRAEYVHEQAWRRKGVFGDDIYHAAHRFRTVQRSGRTFHYFDALHKSVGDAAQSIHRGEPAHDRHTVYGHHRVRSFHAVDVDVAGAANVAVELGPHAVDDRERFKNARGSVFLKKPRRVNLHRNGRSVFGHLFHGG